MSAPKISAQFARSRSYLNKGALGKCEVGKVKIGDFRQITIMKPGPTLQRASLFRRFTDTKMLIRP